MSEQEEHDSTFIIGFVLGFVGSLAGLAAAVSTSRAYTTPAMMGAAANLTILLLLVLLELAVPGAVFGLLSVSWIENSGIPAPMVLLGVGAFVLLILTASVYLFLRTAGSTTEDGTFMGITNRDLPLLMMGILLLIVVGVGGSWWFVSASPSAAVTVHEGPSDGRRGGFGQVEGAYATQGAVSAAPAEPSEVAIRCSTLMEDEELQGRVVEHDSRDAHVVGAYEIGGDDDGNFTFVARHPDGEGVLRAWGFEPVRVVWAGGHCHGLLRLTRRPRGTFRVSVAAMRFTTLLEVSACGGTLTGAGPEVVIPVYDVDEDCAVEVSQEINGIRLHSPVVHARGRIGEEVVVPVRAPEAPPLAHTDPGWRLGWDGGSLTVQGIYPRSQAERARIALGDRVIELRGQPWPTDDGAVVNMPVTATIERPGGKRRTIRLPVP